MGDNKFERIDSLKDRIIMMVEGQLCGDLSSVDAQELGEVMDMAKDCAELKKYCAEADYYHEITEAMKKNKDPENAYYMDKYAPETMRYYAGGMSGSGTSGHSGLTGNGVSGGHTGGRYYPIEMYYPPYADEMMYDERYDKTRTKMYYTPMHKMPDWEQYPRETERPHDPKEGRAYASRRGYMEAKETGNKAEKTKELEQYMNDMAADITEMINGMEPTEKQALKARLTQVANKIV